MQEKAKESCMISFRLLHSHLKFFIGTIFLNLDQLEKQPDKEEFQELKSIAAFRVLETQFQKFIDSRFSLDDDDGLMDAKSRMIELEMQVESIMSWNDTNADDADIRPIYDEDPMDEVQLTAECNVFAIGQQHIEQPEFNNEGEVDQNAEQCHDKCPLLAKLTDNKINELSNQSHESENICFKKTCPISKRFFKNGNTLYCS
uniref:Uncharacterized protein n=1 Tax=Tanacetum cinerariifolium TaxID=118510 RepID=A0A699HW02_TANCI|nr:hypothetical protein [Tanacetum cinerariifolium]